MELYNHFTELITMCNEIMSYYIITHNLLTNLGGPYMSWEAHLAYPLGGISSQFPSNFWPFAISLKKGCSGINVRIINPPFIKCVLY